MPVPDFQTIMLPMLKLAADGKEHSLSDTRQQLAQVLGLSEADVTQRLPSGLQTVWANRVAWAKVHLDRAGLLGSLRRGVFVITDRGRKVLQDPPVRITLKFLSQYPEFVAFRARRTSEDEEAGTEDRGTPEEVFERAYQEVRTALAGELLARVKAGSPEFFERMVVELLINMGYGGSRAEAGAAIGKSGDEGIDGIISDDRLGLELIYIQAKRWDGSVGRPEIQKFVGALQGKRARKGVFITTGAFTADAQQYVNHIETKVVLIDGKQLADYMIDFDIGVTTKSTYTMKRIDSDYFIEE